MRPIALSLLLCLALGGCFGPTTEKTTTSDGKSLDVTTLTTPYTPKQSVERVVAVMKRLQLGGDSGSWNLFGGGDDWSIKSDYYSATTHGKTAAGEKIDVIATWIADGKTELKIQSTLSDAQHRNLVQQIADAMK
jgi:hypothetical protein